MLINDEKVIRLSIVISSLFSSRSDEGISSLEFEICESDVWEVFLTWAFRRRTRRTTIKPRLNCPTILMLSADTLGVDEGVETERKSCLWMTRNANVGEALGGTSLETVSNRLLPLQIGWP